MTADRLLGGGIGIDIGLGSATRASIAGGEGRESRAEAEHGPRAPLEAALAALAAGVDARDRPAWISWSEPEVAVERVDVAGFTPAQLGRHLSSAASRSFVAVLLDGQEAVLVRWDQGAVTSAVTAAVRAGFDVVGCAPGSCARRWGHGDAALGAARAAARLVPVRPLRRPAPATAPARPDVPWVLERIDDGAPDAPLGMPRWRRPWSRRAR